MRKIKLSLLCIIAMASPVAIAQNGLFFALDVGASKFSGLPNEASIGAINLHQNYATLRPSLGYNHDLYSRFGLGFEVASTWYGNTKYRYFNGATTEISNNDLEFLAVGTVHMYPRWDLFLKLGGARFNTDVRGIFANSKTCTNITLESGLGVAYNFTNHLALTLNYVLIVSNSKRRLNALRWKMPTVNSGFIGIRYNFGS